MLFSQDEMELWNEICASQMHMTPWVLIFLEPEEAEINCITFNKHIDLEQFIGSVIDFLCSPTPDVSTKLVFLNKE